MKKPRKYIKKRLVELFRILNQPQRCFKNETFHQLRLEIKKLKAYIELVQSTSSYSLEVCKPLKNIFRIAGDIRNHQLSITKLLSIYPETINNYKLSIYKKIKKLKDVFFKMLNKISFKNIYSNYKKQLKYCNAISYNSVNHYINTLKSEIVYKFYIDQEKNESLHAERILLKKYIYVQKFIKSQQNNLPKLIELTEMLGNWHDNLIIETQLKKSIQSGKIVFNELEVLKSGLDNIIKVKNQLFEQSLQKISTVVIDNPIFLTFRVYI
jgi:CHAD domain-containing protein